MTRTRTLAALVALAFAFLAAGAARAHDGMTMTMTGAQPHDDTYDNPPGGPSPSAGCPGAQHVVTVAGTSFSPPSITINQGESVCWTWDTGGAVPHTVTADDGSFDSGAPATSNTLQFTFSNPGTFGYYCQVHGSKTGGMRGTVIVEQGDGGGDPGGGDPGGGDDQGPGTLQLSSASYEVTENAGPVTVTVQRVGGHQGTVSVKLTETAGTAKSRRDYLPRTAVLKWTDGDTSDRQVQIGIKNDSTPEPDETFSVVLSKATGHATLGTARATVTIHDDDGGGCPTATAAPAALKATGASSGEIELAWAAAVTPARALIVERRDEDGDFHDIATLAAAATTFVDRDLPAATTFLYRLRAEGANGSVAWSPVAAAATDGLRGACAPEALCLADGRFEAIATWRPTASAPARAADGESIAERPHAAMFAFRDGGDASGADLHLLLDVVDSCATSGHFGVLLAGVSDAETLVRVRDTVTGHIWVSYHPAGSAPAAVRDAVAFATCP